MLDAFALGTERFIHHLSWPNEAVTAEPPPGLNPGMPETGARGDAWLCKKLNIGRVGIVVLRLDW